MADEKPNAKGQYWCLGCLLAPVILFVGLSVMGWMLKKPQPTYQEGYERGKLGARFVIEEAGPQNSQDVDRIVDSVVERKRDEIYSHGEEYARGWIAGVKDDLNNSRLTTNPETGEFEEANVSENNGSKKR